MLLPVVDRLEEEDREVVVVHTLVGDREGEGEPFHSILLKSCRLRRQRDRGRQRDKET